MEPLLAGFLVVLGAVLGGTLVRAMTPKPQPPKPPRLGFAELEAFAAKRPLTLERADSAITVIHLLGGEVTALEDAEKLSAQAQVRQWALRRNEIDALASVFAEASAS